MATTLKPGDLAIIGVNSDNPDVFSFVLLAGIEAGTEIFFTDNGVFDDGTFRSNEGILKYTAPAALSAGTVVEFTGVGGDFDSVSGSFALATAGDQVIAFQGTVSNPTFIYAVQTNSTQFQATATSSNDSALPTGLEVGVSAVAVGAGPGAGDEIDNSTYNESVTSGTQAELLAAISNAANWNGSNERIAMLADGPFTVTGSGGGGGTTPPDVVINELRISSPGSSDDLSNFVEILGASGTSLDGLSLVVLSGEFAPGQVDFVFDLSGLTIDGDNLLLIANPDIQNVIPQAVVESNDRLASFDFFGSPSTFLIVDGFTGAQGDDLDADDDGVLDTSIGTVIDSVSLVDGDSTPDRSYSTTIVSPSDSFTPAGVARIPDETGNFQTLVFNSFAADTPGTLNVVEPPVEITPIYEIQGAAHTSPLVGQSVTTTGIVTAVDSNGFYLQDPAGDGNIATSDAIFVFTNSQPGVNVGESVQVSGTVSEFIPGGADTGNLSITQISGNPTIATLSTGNPLPISVVLGVDRTPPTQTIDDDLNSLYNVLQGEGEFEPAEDGLDFYESLEGMRVTINQPLAVAGTSRFGEIFTVVNNGANATNISDRGTINIGPNDFNPERVQIDDDSFTPGNIPIVDTGARLNNVTGVVSYGFGNFEVLATEAVTVADESSLTPEVSTLSPAAGQLTVASYNVLNLDPNDGDGDTDIGSGRFDAIANDIVNNLNLPDIIGLQEIQDNDGSVISSISAADQTLQRLVDEIAEISGVTYEFIDNPFIGDDTSGGQPGGNIRNAFLYNPNRVSLSGDPQLDQPFQGAVQTVVDPQDQQTNPNNPFFGTRLPLVGFFTFNGQEVVVVNNHFSSKGGSAPLFGALQPTADFQENATINGDVGDRREQAQAVKAYIEGLSQENIAAIGDFNEFEFISPLDILEETLTNLTETLPPDERYSFIFEGNSQALDHILVSESLLNGAAYDIVHLNAEFAVTDERASDHDPLLARFQLNRPPIATDDVATANQTSPKVISAEALLANDSDPDGDPLTLSDVDSVAVNASGETVADISLTTDGDILFTPTDSSFSGEATFNYTVADSSGSADEATVEVFVGITADLGNGRDDFEGTLGDDIITGGNSPDTLVGLAGDDRLFGSNGPDELFGGDGDDLLEGGNGPDLLDGGSGIDVAQYQGVLSDYSVSGSADNFTIRGPQVGNDTLISIEFLQFTEDNSLVATADIF